MNKKEKYKWIKDGVSYTVFHQEGGIKTLIALCDTSEKAHLIVTALNKFQIQ